jgi:hypothetical protein
MCFWKPPLSFIFINVCWFLCKIWKSHSSDKSSPKAPCSSVGGYQRLRPPQWRNVVVIWLGIISIPSAKCVCREAGYCNKWICVLLGLIQDLAEEINTERRESDSDGSVPGVWILMEVGSRIMFHSVLALLNFITMRPNLHWLLSRHCCLLNSALQWSPRMVMVVWSAEVNSTNKPNFVYIVPSVFERVVGFKITIELVHFGSVLLEFN